MQNRKKISLLFFISLLPLFVSSLLGFSDLSLDQKVLRYILHKGPYSQSVMSDLPQKRQKLRYEIIGLHTRSCQVALSRLSQYTRYKEWVSLIKESRYSLAQKRVFFKISHTLLPFNMGIDFKLPIIKKPGHYLFEFDKGFLKGLKGIIKVKEKQNRCLFHTQAQWQGPHTGINSTLFSFFSRTLGVLTMKKLFSISRIY